jgi:hypothetical protein
MTMKHLHYRSDMKHFGYAGYDEKMKNASFHLKYMLCSAILTVEGKTHHGKILE